MTLTRIVNTISCSTLKASLSITDPPWSLAVIADLIIALSSCQ